MNSLTFNLAFLGFTGFSNAYKRRALLLKGLITGLETALRNRAEEVLIKIIRLQFAFTVFFSYASKHHNKSNSFQYILRGTCISWGAYNPSDQETYQSYPRRIS